MGIVRTCGRGAWLCVLLLAAALLACPAGRAETLRFGGVEADRTAEFIDMGDERIEDWPAFLDFLGGFPELRRVDLFGTPVKRAQIEALTGAFPDVRFGMTMCIGDHRVRTDATAFSTLHTPDDRPHGDADLALLRHCTRLYALDLGHNRLTDLEFLRDLPELRILIVSMNELTDISPVGSLRHLEYLEMFGNRITDVSCLRDLPYLTDLNLVRNRIGSPEVLGGIQSLRRLWMGRCHTGLPAAQIRLKAEALEAALPACTVDAVSTGIGGGWREHPRYAVIRRIFSTGVYEPFADSPEENRPAPVQAE